MKNTPMVWLAGIVGILLLIIGYIYATHTADTLPHWLPGYDATVTKVHGKHAFGAIILGIACFVFAWFQSGPKKAATPSE